MKSPKEIPPEVYNDTYYLSDAIEGYSEYLNGFLSYTKARQVAMLSLSPGMRVLEIGFARGELLRELARQGVKATGLELSIPACRIGQTTLAGANGCSLVHGDCRQVPFGSDSFDRVFAGDVIEHLPVSDGIMLLSEMFRVLRPGGFLLVHTTPNLLYRRITYPLARPILRLINPDSVEGSDKMFNIMDLVHAHEYTTRSLTLVARRARLPEPKVWIDADILRGARHKLTTDIARNPLVRFAVALSRFSLARNLLGNDIYLQCGK